MKGIFCCQKNPILSVFLIEEISLQPELSCPPRLKIQGGGVLWALRRTEGWKSLCLILDNSFEYLFISQTLILNPSQFQKKKKLPNSIILPKLSKSKEGKKKIVSQFLRWLNVTIVTNAMWEKWEKITEIIKETKPIKAKAK